MASRIALLIADASSSALIFRGWADFSSSATFLSSVSKRFSTSILFYLPSVPVLSSLMCEEFDLEHIVLFTAKKISSGGIL